MLASTSWRLNRPAADGQTALAQPAHAPGAFLLGRLRTAWQRTRAACAAAGCWARCAAPGRGLARNADTGAGRTGARRAFRPVRPANLGRAARVRGDSRVYNKIAYTVACLRSLAQHADATPFEVIVVDDGSSDATAVRLAQIDGLRVLRNAQNLGFVGSCNCRRGRVRGEFVFFLNNDTVVTAGWLQALLRCFSEGGRRGPGGRQAGLSRRSPAGSRRHRVPRRLGLELRPLR